MISALFDFRTSAKTVYKYKIFIYYIITSLSIFTLFAWVMYIFVNRMSYDNIAEKSVDLALIISKNDEIKKAILINDLYKIKSLMAENYSMTDASYIAIGNSQNTRIYHTYHKFIDQQIVDTPDNVSLGEGHYYTQTKKGASGMSVSTRAPIFMQDKYLGFVSVGYLEKKRLSSVYKYFISLSFLLFSVMIIILAGSILSWRLLIKQLSGLSPEVINYRYQIRRAILNAIYDGIIAVDMHGKILAINRSAIKLLSLNKERSDIVGHKISEFVTPDDDFFGRNHIEYYEEDITFNGSTYIATRTTIFDENNKTSGFVIYFKERKSDLLLESQIRKIKHQSEELRVMSHEYKNKMAIISGLIEISEYDRVHQYIFKENNEQKFYDNIIRCFQSPPIVGLILGKISKAKECAIDIIIDPLSQYTSRNVPINDDEMACILGNLIDNAIEAIVGIEQNKQEIYLYLNDDGDEIVLSVQDNGKGIDKSLIPSIFDLGMTSKKTPNHGIGLNLVHSLVTRAKGVCIIEQMEDGCGTIFSIYIPKNQEQANRYVEGV